MYQTILVPLDGSIQAEAILPHVEKLASCLGSEIVLQYVDETPTLLLERDEVVDMEAYIEKRRRQLTAKKAYLRSIVNGWQAKNIVARGIIDHGAVVSAIMKRAIEEAVDLVAMASHGVSQERGAFYGSVAAGVLNRIDRPLLLIRTKFE